jgi:hypothetical protein
VSRIVEERWMGVGFAAYTEHLPVVDPADGQVVRDSHGLPRTIEHLTLQFQHNNPVTGQPELIVRIPFAPEAKQELLRQITGGIVVPGNGGVPAAP